MATENKYKKGDWVRVLHTDYEEEFPVGSVFRAGDVLDHGVEPDEDFDQLFFCNWEIEPWQPKVGERVRVVKHVNSYGDRIRMDLPIGSVHTVTRVGDALSNKDRPSFTLSGSDVHFYLVENLEPVTDPLPVTEQPAALTIQAGKFYKTRDGRKVGPMFSYSIGKGWWAIAYGDANIWLADGKHKPDCSQGSYMSEAGDLVAEWVDAPVAPPVRDITAATVDAINDEYGPVVREVPPEQPARFKVGDVAEVVRCRPGLTSQIGKRITIARVSGERLYAPCSGCEEMVFYADELEPAGPVLVTPAIVCKIDNGQPLPAARPAVHATVEAADAEAKRLANLHTGQTFGVYALTGTPHKVARVYDHEWQRLAAEGRRPLAVSSLVRSAGIPQGHAERIVGQFAA